MRVLPSSKENRVGFVRIKGKRVMTAPGVQGSETIFKTMDLFEGNRMGKEKCKVVSHQQIAAEEQRKWKQ